MSKIIRSSFFRLVSVILINAFLLFDITWAGGTEVSVVKPDEMLSASIQISQQQFMISFNNVYDVTRPEIQTAGLTPDKQTAPKQRKWAQRWESVKQWLDENLKLLAQAYKSDKKYNDNNFTSGLKSLIPILLIPAIIFESVNLGWTADQTVQYASNSSLFWIAGFAAAVYLVIKTFGMPDFYLKFRLKQLYKQKAQIKDDVWYHTKLKKIEDKIELIETLFIQRELKFFGYKVKSETFIDDKGALHITFYGKLLEDIRRKGNGRVSLEAVTLLDYELGIVELLRDFAKATLEKVKFQENVKNNKEKAADKLLSQGRREEAFDAYYESRRTIVAELNKSEEKIQTDDSDLKTALVNLNKKTGRLNLELLQEKLAELAGEDPLVSITNPADIRSQDLILQAI